MVIIIAREYVYQEFINHFSICDYKLNENEKLPFQFPIIFYYMINNIS